MSEGNFEELFEIYTRIYNLPEQEQKRYIEKEISSKDLKEKLQELLDHQNEADHYFENLFQEAVQPSEDDSIPSSIGPYDIIAPAGRGGMSTVYKARHKSCSGDQFVALKVLRKGVDTEDILLRFQQERQLLSGLNHPAISSLLDAGTTDDGRPWIAMDFVEGIPVTQYCHQQNLGITDRIKLFKQICRIVKYAHRNLVIHRDLKPANILVSAEGEVKLLDFGIAKIYETDHEHLTFTGAQVMTPQYASPEQKQNLALSTSSDQYSLGVLLYKLLTGVRPDEYFSENNSSDIDLNTPPPSISLVCKKLEKVGKFSEEELNLKPETLSHKLKGDLNTIVTKCLQPEPEQRYSSLDELIQDLDNYLDGKPISARTPSFAYRSKKFITRNKLPVSLAAGFVLSLIALSVFAIYYGIERDRFAREIEQERDNAEAVSGFMSSLFEYADPVQGGNIDYTATDILELAEEDIVQFANDRPPRLTATFLKTLTSIRENLGQYDEAKELSDLSLQFISDHDIEDKHLEHQVKLEASLAYIAAEKQSKALGILNEVEQQLNFNRERDRQLLANIYNQRGIIANNKYEYEKSAEYYHKAIDYNKEYNTDLPNSVIYSNLASSLNSLDEQEQALHYLDLALNKAEREIGTTNPLMASIKGTIASTNRRIANYDKAREAAEEALELRKQHLGNNHPKIANSYNTLGMIYRRLDMSDQAREAYSNALEIERDNYGDKHPSLTSPLNNLALLYRRSGELSKAKEKYREVIEIREDYHEKNHPSLAVPYNNIGRVYRDQEEFDKADEYYQKSLDIRIDTYGYSHSRTASMYENLGGLYWDKQNYEDASDYYLSAFLIERDSLNNFESAKSNLKSHIRAQRLSGDVEESIKHIEETESILKKNLSETDPLFLEVKFWAGLYNRYVGNYEKSLSTFQNILSTYVNHKLTEDQIKAHVLNGIGYSKRKLGYSSNEIIEYHERAYDIMTSHLDTYNFTTVGILNHLGINNHNVKQYDQAAEYFNEALVILNDTLNTPNNELAARVTQNMGDMYRDSGNHQMALQAYEQTVNILDSNASLIDMVTYEDVYQRLAALYDEIGEDGKSEEYTYRANNY